VPPPASRQSQPPHAIRLRLLDLARWQFAVAAGLDAQWQDVADLAVTDM
jgi:hypothetical protein